MLVFYKNLFYQNFNKENFLDYEEKNKNERFYRSFNNGKEVIPYIYL